MSTPSSLHCRLVALPTFGDKRGRITVVECEQEVPFPIRRVYHLYDVPPGGVRGGHAHRRLQQIVIAATGSFDVTVDDGRRQRRFHLNRPDEGLFLPTLIWRQMESFAPSSVALVLASEPYDPDDYIRDYTEFLRFVDTCE